MNNEVLILGARPYYYNNSGKKGTKVICAMPKDTSEAILGYDIKIYDIENDTEFYQKLQDLELSENKPIKAICDFRIIYRTGEIVLKEIKIKE